MEGRRNIGSRLWVEALDVEVGDEELDGFLVDFVLPELSEVDDVVQEGRVGHAREAVRLERGLEELDLLLGDVELERLDGQGLRKSMDKRTIGEWVKDARQQACRNDDCITVNRKGCARDARTARDDDDLEHFWSSKNDRSP